MPRSKNKITRYKPNQGNVNNAVKQVMEKGMTIRKAAAAFIVPKSLIGRYVKMHTESENDQFIYQSHNDVKRVFTDQEEEQLVGYC